MSVLTDSEQPPEPLHSPSTSSASAEETNIKSSKSSSSSGVDSVVQNSNESRTTPHEAKFRARRHREGNTVLNKYAIYPTTVPPFVLDSQLEKVKMKENGIGPNDSLLNDNARLNLKDPFLVTYDGKWGKFATNVGSNPAYYQTQQVFLSHDTNSSESNGIDIEKQEVSDNDLSREILKSEIFADLDQEWGGDKRLNKLFNTELAGNFEFKNNEDRTAWFEYVSKVKQYYYLKNNGRKNPQDISNNKSLIQGGKHHHPDWWEELNKDKTKLKRLKQRKIQQWTPGFNHLMVDNQYFVLTLRICSGILCVVSLGLAVKIFLDSNGVISRISTDIGQQPSTIMAICVNAIAVVYIIYIAHDEFSGKPLGLRNPYGKLRLILLDLLFIIFCSANLSLAFNTLYDKRWVCTADGRSDSSTDLLSSLNGICEKQKALSAFLFMMLVMWVTTFSVSIIRVIQKIAVQSPGD